MIGERRQLEGVRAIGIAALIFQIVMNLLVYIIPVISGRYINIPEGITMKSVNAFTFMPLLFIAIASLAGRKKVEIDEIRAEAEEKVRFLNIPNIIFIAYIVIALMFLKDRDAIIAAFIMEVLYLLIILITKNIYMLKMQEKRQLDWKKNWEQPNHDDKESNILWRFKIWFSPHEHVPFAERWIEPFRILFDFLWVALLLRPPFSLISLIFSVFVIPDLLSIIEAILGLQTSMTGICTGVTQTTQGKSSRICYIVYVTDYENEREMKFTIYEPYCCVNELDRVVVVHGIFSKHVMRVQGLKVNAR